MRLMEPGPELAQGSAEIKNLYYRDSDADSDGKPEQVLMENRAAISGLPALVPEADWDDIIYPDIDLDEIDLKNTRREDLLAQDHLYLWRSEDGKLSRPAVLDSLDTPPDACAIFTRNVSRESVEDYCAELDLSEGIERIDLTGDSETLQVTYRAGQSMFVVKWEAEPAIYLLEDPVCFVPGWYYDTTVTGDGN